MVERSWFNFKKHWAEIILQLSDEDRLQIYDSMCKYAFFGGYEETELTEMSKMVMLFIVQALTQDAKNCLPEGRISASYQHWRKDVLKRDNYTCQRCGAKSARLNVHHVKPFALYPELRLDVNNGVTLCDKCHIQVHKELRQWTW